MNEKDGTYITKEGFSKLKKELEELKNVKRKEISRRIEEAKELGDLSENAEYVEAKNEQAFTEGRILELDNILKNVILIDDKNRDNLKVDLGSTIRVKTDDKTVTFIIVGPNETSPEDGKISHESPLGRAFLGKKSGETIQIEVPNGIKQFKIISIQ